MDETIAIYFDAWNEQDAAERRRKLERSLTDDVELVDPAGRWQGIPGVDDRIAQYQATAPGTVIVAASGVDGHHDIARYAWKCVDSNGKTVVDGIDIVERDGSGRLKRIVLFHGLQPPVD